MLTRLFLVQPLAFARVGGSPVPCDAYEWGPNDLTPHGTGRTRLVPAETLVVNEDATLSLKPPDGGIVLKDADGIRPVCPFFELHAAWIEDGQEVEGPVTPDLLAAAGRAPGELRWRVEFRNHKAFHWTKAPDDRIEASVEMTGDDVAAKELRGVAPAGARTPLVPAGRYVPLGQVRLTRPNAAFPELRLRFTPAAGHAYGPENLNARIAAVAEARAPDGDPLLAWLLGMNAAWRGFSLPGERCFLNPDAAWPNYALLTLGDVAARLPELLPRLVELLARLGDLSEALRLIAGPSADLRNLPPGLFARVNAPPKLFASLGMVDDLGDGLITCTLPAADAKGGDKGEDLVARARIVVGPPDWAPDRRPVVSVADGLADRVGRAEVRERAYAEGANEAVSDAEMRDLLDRAWETAGLANLDALNDYFRIENTNRALRPESEVTEEAARKRLWHGRALASTQALPLTARGRDRHRRNTVDLFFDAFLAERHDVMEHWIRTPGGPERLYDKRMPGLMRGCDRRPLTLTRRQYDQLAAWMRVVRARARGEAP